MRRHKKLIVAAVLAGVLLFASLGGVALADNGDGESRFGDFVEKVRVLYEQKTGQTLDVAAFEEAIAETRDEMAGARAEMRQAAMESRLAQLVEEGTITQAEMDDYLEWWQDRPDTPAGFGFRGHGGFRGWCVPPALAE